MEITFVSNVQMNTQATNIIMKTAIKRWWMQNGIWILFNKDTTMMPYYYKKELIIGVGKLQITFAWKRDTQGTYVAKGTYIFTDDYFEQKINKRIQAKQEDEALENPQIKVKNIVKR